MFAVVDSLSPSASYLRFFHFPLEVAERLGHFLLILPRPLAMGMDDMLDAARSGGEVVFE